MRVRVRVRARARARVRLRVRVRVGEEVGWVLGLEVGLWKRASPHLSIQSL